MSRRRKPKTVLGMILEIILTICFFPFILTIEVAKNYRPYNSKGARISRARRKRWF